MGTFSADPPPEIQPQVVATHTLLANFPGHFQRATLAVSARFVSNCAHDDTNLQN
jgi:hypothetical protein